MNEKLKLKNKKFKDTMTTNYLWNKSLPETYKVLLTQIHPQSSGGIT